jgi:hypothetical protein
MADLAVVLNAIVAKHNRRIAGEAIIALGVGIGTSLVVFGFVFWISYLALWFTRPFGLRNAAAVAAIITGVFALMSVWSAWRRHDPMENIQAMDPTLHDLQMGLGYALGVPVVNRQSIAGFSSLLIGGPANAMDAWSIWRSRLPTDAATISQAAQLLHDARNGLAARMVRNAQALAVLHRLGLIKVVSRGREAQVQTTIKAMEVLNPNKSMS